jgi:hypothetical protein
MGNGFKLTYSASLTSPGSRGFSLGGAPALPSKPNKVMLDGKSGAREMPVLMSRERLAVFGK